MELREANSPGIRVLNQRREELELWTPISQMTILTTNLLQGRRNLFTRLEDYTRSDVAKDFLIPDSSRKERKETLMGAGDRVQQG
ncbi:hypothetical protein Q9233_004011 [Columba guinea]|nr:hypothetical protein Q9233_004011 [Columba guinea]